MSEKINIHIMLTYSSAIDHSWKSREILLKNLFICISKFSVIIKDLKTSCEHKMYKIII